MRTKPCPCNRGDAPIAVAILRTNGAATMANLQNATERHVEQHQGGDGHPNPPVWGSLMQHLWMQLQ